MPMFSTIKTTGLVAFAILGSLLGTSILTPAKADVVYQSAPQNSNYTTSYGVQSSGNDGASNTEWFGQVITLSQALTITSIGAEFTGGSPSFSSLTANGTVFGAIVQLNASNSANGKPNFSGSSLANNVAANGNAYALFTPNLASGQQQVVNQSLANGAVTLGPGTYAIIFGSGALGANGLANITVGTPDTPSTADGVTEYTNPGGSNPNYNGTAPLNDIDYINGNWGNGPAANIVIDMNGTVAAVPELSTWAMLVLGFLGVGAFGYRHNRNRDLRLIGA